MKKLILITFLFLFLMPNLAQADSLVPCGGEGEASCTFCHFFVMLDRIINFGLSRIVPAVAALLLVVGGAMFIFGGADPALITKGKSIMTSVVIGLIIIFVSWLIINLFFMVIGVSELSGLKDGWFTIKCSV